MKLRDPRARARWRAFVWRARLALVDERSSVRRGLLADLEAHVAEALSREALDLTEAERLERALARVGDPAHFLRPLLDDASRAYAMRRARGRPIAVGAAAVASAITGTGLTAFGVNALLSPQRAGLFQLGPYEYQIRLLGGSSAGESLGAPWLAMASIGAGAALLWVAGAAALRVCAALQFREARDGE